MTTPDDQLRGAAEAALLPYDAQMDYRGDQGWVSTTTLRLQAFQHAADPDTIINLLDRLARAEAEALKWAERWADASADLEDLRKAYRRAGEA